MSLFFYNFHFFWFLHRRRRRIWFLFWRRRRWWCLFLFLFLWSWWSRSRSRCLLFVFFFFCFFILSFLDLLRSLLSFHLFFLTWQDSNHLFLLFLYFYRRDLGKFVVFILLFMISAILFNLLFV